MYSLILIQLTTKVVSPPVNIDTLEGALTSVVGQGFTHTLLRIWVGVPGTVTHVLDTLGKVGTDVHGGVALCKVRT